MTETLPGLKDGVSLTDDTDRSCVAPKASKVVGDGTLDTIEARKCLDETSLSTVPSRVLRGRTAVVRHRPGTVAPYSRLPTQLIEASTWSAGCERFGASPGGTHPLIAG